MRPQLVYAVAPAAVGGVLLALLAAHAPWWAVVAAAALAGLATARLLEVVEVVNSGNDIVIDADVPTVWRFLADVRNLKQVHVPCEGVDVVEDADFGAECGVRTTRWIEHTRWGNDTEARLREIRTVAVLESAEKGYVENVNMRRLDRNMWVYIHFAHRFTVEAVGSCRTRLTETESIQSHRYVVGRKSGNTDKVHQALFRNIKAAVEKNPALAPPRVPAVAA